MLTHRPPVIATIHGPEQGSAEPVRAIGDDIPQWAVACAMNTYPSAEGSIVYSFERHDGVICALALGLLHVEHHSGAENFEEDIRSLAIGLERFLLHEKMAIAHATQMSLDADANNVGFSTPVWPTIFRTLVSLAKRNPRAFPNELIISIVDDLRPVFAKGNDHLRSLIPKMNRLQRICSGEAHAHSMADSTLTGWQIVDLVSGDTAGSNSSSTFESIPERPSHPWNTLPRSVARFIKHGARRITGRQADYVRSIEGPILPWVSDSSPPDLSEPVVIDRHSSIYEEVTKSEDRRGSSHQSGVVAHNDAPPSARPNIVWLPPSPYTDEPDEIDRAEVESDDVRGAHPGALTVVALASPAQETDGAQSGGIAISSTSQTVTEVGAAMSLPVPDSDVVGPELPDGSQRFNQASMNNTGVISESSGRTTAVDLRPQRDPKSERKYA